ncbi:MAG: 4Fe-4S binding protein [Calditrichia bacterium]
MAVTKHNPIIFSIDWNACIQCAVCIAVCPQEAGFTSPFDTIATGRPCAIVCMLCENACPVTAIDHEYTEELEIETD